MKIFSRVETALLCLWMVFLVFTLQQAGAYLAIAYLSKDIPFAVIENGGVDGTLTSFAMLFTLIAVVVIIIGMLKWKIKQVLGNKRVSNDKIAKSQLHNEQRLPNSQSSYTVSNYLAIKPFRWRVAIALIGIWLLFLIASEALTYFLDKNPTEFMDALYSTAHPKWLFILGVVLIVPIYEELLFRGVLWSALSNQAQGLRGIWLASIVTSLLFALIHLQYDIYEMSTIFVLSLILSLARHKSGSLLLPILIHSINNGIAMWQYLTY